MSIASAIQNAQQKVANAYTAVSTMGGTLPSTQDLANLPAAILTIQSGILEGLLDEIVAGNNPVDTTDLSSIETQIHAFLGST